ncbi:MAG: DNA translocase FtsK, partial [Bacilli bacterium]|nr:DNA translocase FtsK [Bacilli bacterium]
RKELINATFVDFGVGAHVEDYTIGPSVTRFNVKYDHNVSVRSVSNMVQDIQIRLSGVSARFENIVEGQSTSGLEIPNANVTTVSFKDVYEALPDVKKHPLAVAFGKNIKGDVIYADFDEFPHALVAGTTGSGKSIFVNSIIVSLIMRNSPDDLKMVLVDPKKVEMARYKDMPHLLCPIITEAQEAKALMDKLCVEMEDRYKLFAENGCSNIKEYNEDAPSLGLEKLPYIMIFFDEYADMVDQCKEISMPVVSIAQKARACGIHMCIATQRPSTNVVTGVIKANLPTHVALMMASSVDSMTIIGEGGAEKLIGKGDMLVQSPLVSRVGVVRLQGCFIHRQEINRVVGYLKEHYETRYDDKYLNLAQAAEAAASEYANSPEFKESAGNSEEERYQAIKEWVLTQEFMSISRIQRECAVGFNRAGRFFLRLQSEGVVGSDTEGNKGCRVNSESKFSQDSVVTSDEQTSFRSDD